MGYRIPYPVSTARSGALKRQRESATERSAVADSRASAWMRLRMMTREPAEGIFDLHVPLEQAPELERPEVHVPDSVIDLFEPYVFADADGGDVDPSPVPANAAIGAHVAHLEAIGIHQRRQPVGHLSI